MDPIGKSGARTLVVSLDEAQNSQIRDLFTDGKLSLEYENDVRRILSRFQDEQFDILIMASGACKPSDTDCVGLIKHVSRASPTTQILLLVEPDDVNLGLEGVRAGGFQYTKTPISNKELKRLIEVALHRQPQAGRNSMVQNANPDGFGSLVGRSESMQAVYQQMDQAARTDVPILLIGETGTGKDVIAKTIHQMSKRSAGPYAAVNLGALPTEMVASELFGHAKGSFTGATSEHEGVLEHAEGGTVFLDEIDTIDEKVRVSLLRVIEQKAFTKLGGRKKVKTDVRIITASNADLEGMADSGAFRKDLFYRLDVFRINVPPLRDRRSDIPLLVERFLDIYNRNFDKRIKGCSSECLDVLRQYDWPGNVRELKNAVQRAVLVCETDELRPQHLPSRFLPDKPPEHAITFTIGTPLDEVERRMVLRALAVANNNRKEAAALLGISRRAIYNKLKKHDID